MAKASFCNLSPSSRARAVTAVLISLTQSPSSQYGPEMAFTILLVREAHREADIEVISNTKILLTLFLSPPLHQSNLQMLEGLFHAKYL